MTEVTFLIEGKGTKGDNSSFTEITFTKIKIGDDKEEDITNDSGPEHKEAKEVLTKLLSNSTVKGNVPVIPNSTTGATDNKGIDGGSSHKRKSYKKEKKMKGGKRKSIRRYKHV